MAHTTTTPDALDDYFTLCQRCRDDFGGRVAARLAAGPHDLETTSDAYDRLNAILLSTVVKCDPSHTVR